MGYGNEWSHGDKQIDWDKVSTAAPKPPAPGLYDAKIAEVQVVETKGDGGKPKVPMLKVRMEIVAVREGGSEDAIGRKLFDNWVMSQEGAFKVKNAAAVAGKELPGSLEYDDLSAFASSFEGEIVPVMIDTRKYEGKENANVRYYGEEAPSDDRNGESNGNGKARESHPPRSASKSGKGGKAQARR